MTITTTTVKTKNTTRTRKTKNRTRTKNITKTKNTTRKTTKRLHSLNLSNISKVEVPCFLSSSPKMNIPEILNRKICGRMDCKDGNNIYEFKCVEKLEKTHYLQLAIYMYINEMNLLINNNNNNNNNNKNKKKNKKKKKKKKKNKKKNKKK